MFWAARRTSWRVTSWSPTVATTPAAGPPPKPKFVPNPPGIRVMTMAPQKTSRMLLSTTFLTGPGVCKNRIIFLSLQKIREETLIIDYYSGQERLLVMIRVRDFKVNGYYARRAS